MLRCTFIACLALGALAQKTNNASLCNARTLHLADPPYQNYFYSDCNVDAQAVVTSPEPDSNLKIIGPRFIVAWPAGNSGICTFFQPQSGRNGSLAIELVNSTLGSPLAPVYSNASSSRYPFVGVEGVISFNDSAELSVAILGSVRNIRDFTEGPSLLSPLIQDGNRIETFNETGVQLSRQWLDNTTRTTLTISPWRNNDTSIHITNKTVRFGAGFYRFSASLNYPQLKQLEPAQIFNNKSQSLVRREPEQVTALSFFSYSEKLLAGGWRFLTYFGRDTMIAALLLEPVLKIGKGTAIEAVIGAALERVNRTDGSVCHEETIGDYATYLNYQKNVSSSDAGFVYPMIDTDYFLPILMQRYFRGSPSRIVPLLKTQAGKINKQNSNLTWGDLSYATAHKIMNLTAAFETEQTIDNLIHLKEGEIVGQWRDSTYGLGNARIPFDVNTALVPAGLYAIAELAAMPGVFPNNSITRNWPLVALKRARVWEDKTLPLFTFNRTVEKAESLLRQFTKQNTFYKGPTHADSLHKYSHNGTIVDYGLAINSTASPDILPITHTDTAFRHFLLNSTDDKQLTAFINSTANAILRPFPAGLTTPVGAVVANPSLAGQEVLTANFTNAAYHGTVIWSWQLALLARGFELQLDRCSTTNPPSAAGTGKRNNASVPAFCRDDSVHGALRKAYNHLWDVIENNKNQLQSEVWSWTYSSANNTKRSSTNETLGDGETDQGYRLTPLGALPPPPGVSGATESNIRQTWSLTFLALQRNTKFR